MDFCEIKERLLKLDTACVCDANKQLRVLDGAIRPINQGVKLVGRAHTVQCHEDFLTVIKALRDAEPDDAIVIDSQGSKRALTGELFPTEAIRKGLAGIVNDGPCRDTAAIRRLQFPYYARSVYPVSGTTVRLGETQIPITCGGVRVAPGDILFGDEDGVVVATVEELAEAIPAAEEVQRQEDRLLEEMEKGKGLLEMTNFEEHCAALAEGKESKVSFLV